MKRIYIKPTMKIHDVEMDLMLATSGVPNLNIMDSGATIDNESDMLSRDNISNFNIWDQGW